MSKEDHVQNGLKRRLANREPAVVMSLRLARTVDVVGLIAAAGYDAFYVDLQHSTISLEDAGQLCTAGIYAGLTPLVRVPGADEGIITRVLDGGAMGIIVPDVRSEEDARAIAAWSRFPPAGVRSATGPLALMRHRKVPASVTGAVANAETLVIAMLESPEAVGNAEKIACVEGIDALFIGTNDLTSAMGIHGQYRHPDVQAAYRRAIAATNAYGKHLLVGGIADPAIVKEYVALGAAPCGFTGMDAALLLESASAKATAFRAELEAR